MKKEQDTLTGEINNTRRERRWSIYYCHGQELERKEITYSGVKFPYQIYKLHNEDVCHEFYGIFRDAIGHQNAINNAQVAMHKMINMQKKLIGDEGLGENNIDDFNTEMSSPSATAVMVGKVEQIKDAVPIGAAQEQLSIIQYHTEKNSIPIRYLTLPSWV